MPPMAANQVTPDLRQLIREYIADALHDFPLLQQQSFTPFPRQSPVTVCFKLVNIYTALGKFNYTSRQLFSF